jgi:hypothetical protein
MLPSQAELWPAILTVINKYGLTQLSVTKIAEVLAIKPAVLQRDFSSVNALYDFIQEFVFQQLLAKIKDENWESHLRNYAHDLRSQFKDCPGLVNLFILRPSVTPSGLSHTNMSIGLLKKAGFSAGQGDYINHSVGLLSISFALVEHGVYDGINPESLNINLPTLDPSRYPNSYEAFQCNKQNYLENWFKFSLDSMIQGFKSTLKTNNVREVL